MFFGIGLFELLLAFGVIAAPVLLLVFGIRALLKRSSPHDFLKARNRALEGELRAAHDQIEEMQNRLNAAEEELSFTDALLEGKQSEL